MNKDFKTSYSVLDFIKNLDFNLSYDYDELIEEFKQDLTEFKIKQDDYIYIVRDLDDFEIYPPIIDYYFNDDFLEEDINRVEKMQVKDVLAEMIYLNQIIKNDNIFDKEKH